MQPFKKGKLCCNLLQITTDDDFFSPKKCVFTLLFICVLVGDTASGWPHRQIRCTCMYITAVTCFDRPVGRQLSQDSNWDPHNSLLSDWPDGGLGIHRLQFG
jgi:hypothetical protein